jgi:hypothetical protein
MPIQSSRQLHRKEDRRRADSPLPAGFFRTLHSRTSGCPELRLAAAVLEDAAHTFRRNRGAVEFHRRVLYWEVERWFASRSHEPVFSFERVCSMLGLDADEIRRILQTWAKRRSGAPVPWLLELPTRHRTRNSLLRLISSGHFRVRRESEITGNPSTS